MTRLTTCNKMFQRPRIRRPTINVTHPVICQKVSNQAMPVRERPHCL